MPVKRRNLYDCHLLAGVLVCWFLAHSTATHVLRYKLSPAYLKCGLENNAHRQKMQMGCKPGCRSPKWCSVPMKRRSQCSGSQYAYMYCTLLFPKYFESLRICTYSIAVYYMVYSFNIQIQSYLPVGAIVSFE